MTDHWDAFGVGLILLVLGVIVLAAVDRANTRHAAGLRAAHRALSAQHRAECRRLHRRYAALTAARVTVEQADQTAELPDQPIPYTPVWTNGAAAQGWPPS